VRGAWIEIIQLSQNIRRGQSLPVRGAWIEIPDRLHVQAVTGGRSPCGERGLKFVLIIKADVQGWSLPVRGAWIEMSLSLLARDSSGVAPRAGSVD